MTWKDLTEEQLEELIDQLPKYSSDIYNLKNEGRDLSDAFWTYVDRNPIYEKYINDVVVTMFNG